MFDVAQFDTRTASEKGVEMSILNPKTGAPFLDSDFKPVTITLLGPNGEVSKTKQRELSLRRADMERRGIPLDEEYYQRERFEFLSTVTIGWSFDKMGGEDFPFSQANVSRLWADERWPWLAIQAFNFSQQAANFLPLSSG